MVGGKPFGKGKRVCRTVDIAGAAPDEPQESGAFTEWATPGNLKNPVEFQAGPNQELQEIHESPAFLDIIEQAEPWVEPMLSGVCAGLTLGEIAQSLIDTPGYSDKIGTIDNLKDARSAELVTPQEQLTGKIEDAVRAIATALLPNNKEQLNKRYLRSAVISELRRRVSDLTRDPSYKRIKHVSNRTKKD